jgi:hypothetical protein
MHRPLRERDQYRLHQERTAALTYRSRVSAILARGHFESANKLDKMIDNSLAGGSRR